MSIILHTIQVYSTVYVMYIVNVRSATINSQSIMHESVCVCYVGLAGDWAAAF